MVYDPTKDYTGGAHFDENLPCDCGSIGRAGENPDDLNQPGAAIESPSIFE